MSKKLIDISYWQGNVDFSKIKASGFNYVILRAGYGTTVDPKFTIYAKDCANNGIKIGVYWFCYSTSVAEVKKEAQKCIATIKPYSIDLPVFFDFEYDTVKKAKSKGVTLGKNECSAFTIAFCDTIKAAGYTPGYYANTDYYQNMYTDEVRNRGYVFWLAHYKIDRCYHEPPIACDFFQYSDSGKVAGIGGNAVDMDICFTEKYLNCKGKQNTNIGSDIVTKLETVNKLITIAANEIGYLEKASNANLDSKTANAGSNNYTKYWRDMANLGLGNYQAQYWCACFVHWCFYKAYGLKASQSLLLQNFFINCQVMYNIATNKGCIYTTPQVGDVVLFWTSSSGQYGHTGIVVAVNGGTFTTIEGNTSGGSTVVANGGGVAKKTYNLSNLNKPRFVRPNYSLVSGTSSTANPTFKRTNSGTCTGDLVNVRLTPGGTVISQLSKGNRFDVDGQVSGDWVHISTSTCGVGWMHKDYVKLDKTTSAPKPVSKPSAVKLVAVDGVQLPELKASQKPSGDAVGFLQTILKVKVTNKWNDETANAVKAFKGNVGLPANSSTVGANTWKALMIHVSKQIKNNA